MKTMTSRERLLTALNNGRPDRLPCQVHSWMPYYLKTYLNGIDQWEAYKKFDMDYVIYADVDVEFDKKDLAKWKVERKDLGVDANGNKCWEEQITTPKGKLHHKGAITDITVFETENLIKTKEDFEIFNEFWPVPVKIDTTGLKKIKARLGDKGIVRAFAHYYPGQGSPWQALCFIAGTQESIMWAMDDPQWVHHAMESLLQKSIKFTQLCEGIPSDIVEIGGGAASNTVISPKMFREFCLPYDKRQIEYIHAAGPKVVYHLCGGMMKMADMVIETGSDGLETMTPPLMGGDCNLKEASRLFGDRLFFIGGFDQNAGFENGSPEDAKRLVFECFEATKDNAGYIVSPSDHFFNGNPENIYAFVAAAKECRYYKHNYS